MKLKTFGLIEAIAGSAILIIFAVAIGLVSTKSAGILDEAKHRQFASKIAQEFIFRTELLSQAGILTTAGTAQNMKIPIDCLSSDKGKLCKAEILNAYPQNLFPFFDIVSDEADGNHYLISSDYLKSSGIDKDFYKFRSKIENCDHFSSCKKIKIEIVWTYKGQQKKYVSEQIF